MSKKYFFLLFVLLSLFATPLAFAASVPPPDLVPQGCQTGCPCSLCDLYTLGRNIVNFLLYGIAIPVAAIAILYGGVMMLISAGDPKKITDGKSAISSAVIGIAITFFAWVIINALLSTVFFQIGFVQGMLDWNKPPTCTAGGGTSCNTNLPTNPGTLATGAITNGACLVDGYNVCGNEALVDGSGCPPGFILSPTGEGCSYDQDPKDFTGLKSKVAAYDADILAAAQLYGVPPERIRAIIIAESSGIPGAQHQDLDGQSSYGLMQIRPDTARGLDPNLQGLSDAQIAQRLQDPDYNIQLGTKYYGRLLNQYGGDKDLASAAYNGGPGANLPSRNCPGQRRWQCGWDDDAHTIPNTGYQVTRDYVEKIRLMEGGLT
ncbi:MAG: transglycosylase SLT domain-containing protein [Patescibacteria group bacterium]